MPFKKSYSFFIIVLAMLLPFIMPSGLSADEAALAPPADVSVLENMTSAEVVRHMGLGWNLGNTLECAGDWIKGNQTENFETAWGNPVTTKEMIDAIQAAGFKSVRIPVAWSNMMGGDYTIDRGLMKRVQQVVDWVLADGMIVVVNIHWDGGWWSKFPTQYDESMKRYTRFWSQIAGNFKDYPSSLIFESLNEEGCFNDVWNRWGPPAPEKKLKAYTILNNINQAFVDLVRSTGGGNAKRNLLIAGYATDIDLTVDEDFVVPKDPSKHSILSIHYYTPYTFAGLEHDESWGKARSTWGTKEDFDELDGNLQKLKVRFLDHGVPIILGEYGATLKTKDPESVRRYILSVAQRTYQLGICPMLWDPGSHFNRKTLVFNDTELLDGFQSIKKGTKPDEVENTEAADSPAACHFSILEDALSQAGKNAASPEGADYEKQFASTTGNDLEGYLRVCTIDNPQKRDLEIVLKIKKSGKVSDVYAESNDPLAVCVAYKLAGEKCPRPPFEPYLELINFKVKN